MEKKYRVAQFGTFDVESMGDSLFPRMLLHGLCKYADCTAELFSMAECEKPYNNNPHVYSFDQFPARHALQPFDAVILGGGEFLHFKSIDFTVNGEKKPYPGGYLWKKPIEMASALHIPVFVNCVGVPFDLTERQQETLRDYLKDARLVAVRDPFSALRLESAGVENGVCAADNVWYLNQVFPKREMTRIRRELETRTGLDLTTPYIAVQYGTTKDYPVLAEELKAIREESGCRICLLPINYCHEDRIGMELLAQAGDGAFEQITGHFQPDGIMSIIAGASAFIGTSLHGSLTAASYGVPFLGIDMYPNFVSKMDGLFAMMDCGRYLVPSVEGVAAAYHSLRTDIKTHMTISGNVPELQDRLDRYFARVVTILGEQK